MCTHQSSVLGSTARTRWLTHVCVCIHCLHIASMKQVCEPSLAGSCPIGPLMLRRSGPACLVAGTKKIHSVFRALSAMCSRAARRLHRGALSLDPTMFCDTPIFHPPDGLRRFLSAQVDSIVHQGKGVELSIFSIWLATEGLSLQLFLNRINCCVD